MNAVRRDPLSFRWAGVLACLIAFLGGAGAPPVLAQEQPVEIPLTSRPPFAARFAGMGGTGLAFADDHNASFMNPATLGLVRQIEFAAGFDHQKATQEVRVNGNPDSRDFGKTRLSELGFVYPYPTYRGSLVFGLAYGRVSGLDSDFGLTTPASQNPYLSEDFFEDGGLGAYAVSLAFQATETIMVGASGIVLNGHSFRQSTFRYQPGEASPDSLVTQDYSINGVTGNIGALVALAHGVRLGMVLNLPESLTLDGSGHEESASVGTADYSFSDKIDLPFRLGVGLAMSRSNFILAADATYADWTQIQYAGPLRTPDGREAYRETIGLHLGGEYLLSLPTPVRLRAGYILEPLPYRLIQDLGNENANIETDRHYVTLGAGVLLGESLTLDVAYMHGGYTRTGAQTPASVFREEQTDNRVLASLSLRLPLGRD